MADRKAAEQLLQNDMEVTAQRVFTHRQWGSRVAIDTALMASGAGLFVNIIRKATGRSFFFHTDKTERQQKLEAASKNKPKLK